MRSICSGVGDRSLITFCRWIGYSMHFSGSRLQNLLACYLMNLVTLIIAIDRIGSLVTTQVELIDSDGLATRFLYIHRDFTLHGTSQVVTTEHLAEVTVGNVQRDITIHIRLIGTSKQLWYLARWLTAQSHIHITIDIGILTSTDNLL